MNINKKGILSGYRYYFSEFAKKHNLPFDPNIIKDISLTAVSMGDKLVDIETAIYDIDNNIKVGEWERYYEDWYIINKYMSFRDWINNPNDDSASKLKTCFENIQSIQDTLNDITLSASSLYKK